MTSRTIKDNPEVPVLTVDALNDVFMACLGTEEDPGVSGIVTSYRFNKDAIASHSDRIKRLLAELPDQFKLSGGGGWTFLNACYDRHGRQWTGLHVEMERLFCLGIAAGLANEMMPRHMWEILPGGVPYYVVLDTPKAANGEYS